MKKSRRKKTELASYALNGLSIDNITLSQDGEIEVEFDIPEDQKTTEWHLAVKGSRSFDVYDDEELQAAARQLFQVLRRKVMQPDPEREKIHCDTCSTSACCRKYNVLLRHSDIERLAEGLGISTKEVVERHTDPAVDWCGDFERQLACDHDDDHEEKCVFLKEDSQGRWRCSIYEFRPQICRDFDMRACDDYVSVEEVLSAFAKQTD